MCCQNGWNNNLDKNSQMLIDIKDMVTEIILPMIMIMTIGCQHSSIECQMLLHIKDTINPNYYIHDDDDNNI